MTNTSFRNWQLSSSDSEDDQVNKIQNMNTSTSKRKINCADVSIDEYVPLSARLKIRSLGTTKLSDDDLPVFNTKDREKLEVPSNNKENCISTLQIESKSNISPSKGKNDDRVIVLNDDEEDMKNMRQTLATKKSKPSKSPRMKSGEKLKSEKPINDKKDEAAKRKALTSHLKTLRPEECLKHMQCMVSQVIILVFENFNFMDELKKDFLATCTLELFDTPCVRWSRKVTVMSEVRVQVNELHDEPEMLVLLPASEFVKLIKAQLDEYAIENADTLTNYVKRLQIENPSVNIHLVCHGVERYNKNLKSKQSRNVKKAEDGIEHRKRKKASLPEVSTDEIEEALVDLQIECKTTVLYIEKPMELINMIKQLTKSIGEAPYKRMKRSDVLFINEIPSIKVNPKTGEGLKKVWKQMIQQFHNVTPVMATAITDRYPSILSLVDAYEQCGHDTAKAEALLADIPVRRGVGTLQTSRRIGPELSYKIYRLLMSRISSERLY